MFEQRRDAAKFYLQLDHLPEHPAEMTVFYHVFVAHCSFRGPQTHDSVMQVPENPFCLATITIPQNLQEMASTV
jgi:hypothetical protein